VESKIDHYQQHWEMAQSNLEKVAAVIDHYQSRLDAESSVLGLKLFEKVLAVVIDHFQLHWDVESLGAAAWEDPVAQWVVAIDRNQHLSALLLKESWLDNC
jgi:hypothetical protein